MSKIHEKKSKLLIFSIRLSDEFPLPNNIFIGILEAMSRFFELPPPRFLPFDQFRRHLQEFLLSPSPGPAHTEHLDIKLSFLDQTERPIVQLQNEHVTYSKHFPDCSGPSAKADIQTRPLAAPDLVAVSDACHSYRRRAPHPTPSILVGQFTENPLVISLAIYHIMNIL